jgi:hypothetical protein
MRADACRRSPSRPASPAGSRRNRHPASDNLPSARCRSPGTSHVSVRRSSARRSRRNPPARLRSSWLRFAATPSVRVANAVCRPWLIHRLRIRSNERVFQYCVCTCSAACSGVAPPMYSFRLECPGARAATRRGETPGGSLGSARHWRKGTGTAETIQATRRLARSVMTVMYEAGAQCPGQASDVG